MRAYWDIILHKYTGWCTNHYGVYNLRYCTGTLLLAFRFLFQIMISLQYQEVRNYFVYMVHQYHARTHLQIIICNIEYTMVIKINFDQEISQLCP